MSVPHVVSVTHLVPVPQLVLGSILKDCQPNRLILWLFQLLCLLRMLHLFHILRLLHILCLLYIFCLFRIWCLFHILCLGCFKKDASIDAFLNSLESEIKRQKPNGTLKHGRHNPNIITKLNWFSWTWARRNYQVGSKNLAISKFKQIRFLSKPHARV